VVLGGGGKRGGNPVIKRERTEKGTWEIRERQLRSQSSTARSMDCIMGHEDRRYIDERKGCQSSEREEAY
jgi:hypothetical protein